MEQTNKQNETYLQSIERKGYSRRDFMKFVAFIGAYMGVESTALGQVAKSLATTPRLPLFGSIFKNAPAVVNLLFGQTILWRILF
jgi:hydrogenase small subunit